MSNTVIQVQGLGKQYQLGKVGTGTIATDLNRWWHTIRGKEDPYLKIGQTNDRTAKTSTNDVVWALKDIDFEVKQGEVLGIIGRNGAGKSTLLKILSRVTAPTVGDIKVKGRIASLLEVGTGFHPDLSGRENIFLNGAILGMTKKEIKSKFDEIVAFSGVERYIDTPVKRYSSGMYVRLAFAVAAHLESEILIVDEVLAVGDAEFQKKCLGKMKDVSSGEGRTVLFVSHNMDAVTKLCQSALYLKNGEIEKIGQVEEIATLYLEQNEKIHESKSVLKELNAKANRTTIQSISFTELKLLNTLSNTNQIFWNQPIVLNIHFELLKPIENLSIALTISTSTNVNIFTANNINSGFGKLEQGNYNVEVSINHNLRAGKYIIHLGARNKDETIWWHTDVFGFSILSNAKYPPNNSGLVLCDSNLNISKISAL